MKRHIYLLLPALIAAASASAKTGAATSGPATDVNTPDSTGMYAEEAQRASLIRDSKVIFVNGDGTDRPGNDSVQSLLRRFYVDQFRNSHDPEAPYFTFMSKDANLAMGIGGTVDIRGWGDWNGMIDGSDFNIYDIPVPRDPLQRRQLGASVSGSSLFFNLMGRHTPIGDFRAYIEAGFDGYKNKGFKLKKAYFQIRDITIGLAKTTFSDPAAQPEVLDGAGPNGKLDKSNILVRYIHTWRDRWTVAGSVEFPSSQPQVTDGETAKLPDYVPDFAALGQFQWNRGMSHMRLAGIIRSIPYRDLISGRDRHVIGWGTQLSTVVRVGRVVTLYGLGSVGKGIASYTGDMSNGDYDLLASPGNAGHLYAPTTVSATAGAKVQITPKLSTTACLSTLRNFAKGSLHDDTYRYGQYLAVNAAYDITPRLQAGIEYLAGKRENFNGEAGNANRALATFIFSF